LGFYLLSPKLFGSDLGYGWSWHLPLQVRHFVERFVLHRFTVSLDRKLTASVVEVVGYGARIVSSQNVTEQTPYSLQFVLIILAPVVMAGVIYLCFGRLVTWVVPPEQRTMKLLWAPRKLTHMSL
jgi:hypothetical protein